MSHQPHHQNSPPRSSRKRKERETFTSVKPPPSTATTLSKSTELDSSNKLLAGCMAYEFLTKGTLFGKEWDSAAQAESADGESSRRLKPHQQSYAEVARLLGSDGPHIRGVVNPTQLARWIHQMGHATIGVLGVRGDF